MKKLLLVLTLLAGTIGYGQNDTWSMPNQFRTNSTIILPRTIQINPGVVDASDRGLFDNPVAQYSVKDSIYTDYFKKSVYYVENGKQLIVTLPTSEKYPTGIAHQFTTTGTNTDEVWDRVVVLKHFESAGLHWDLTAHGFKFLYTPKENETTVLLVRWGDKLRMIAFKAFPKYNTDYYTNIIFSSKLDIPEATFAVSSTIEVEPITAKPLAVGYPSGFNRYPDGTLRQGPYFDSGAKYRQISVLDVKDGNKITVAPQTIEIFRADRPFNPEGGWTANVTDRLYYLNLRIKGGFNCEKSLVMHPNSDIQGYDFISPDYSVPPYNWETVVAFYGNLNNSPHYENKLPLEPPYGSEQYTTWNGRDITNDGYGKIIFKVKDCLGNETSWITLYIKLSGSYISRAFYGSHTVSGSTIDLGYYVKVPDAFIPPNEGNTNFKPSYVIDWGDGQKSEISTDSVNPNGSYDSISHSYSSAGTYKVLVISTMNNLSSSTNINSGIVQQYQKTITID